VGSPVADVSAVRETLSRCGASQPDQCEWHTGERHGQRAVPTDGPASVSSLPPDICDDDDGAADGHSHLPPHVQ